MGAASGGLADDGGALEILEVVAELLRAGESFLGGQDVGGLAVQVLAGDVGQSPILMGHIALALPEIVQVGRLGKQIGGEEGDHFGIAAAVFAEVEDDGIHVGKEIHGGNGGGAADVRVGEKIKLEEADVAG